MKNKKECKILQDLLPNYIERLTSEETNKYIEEHIKECPKCNNTLKNMKNNIKNNTGTTYKKEIDFLKKFNRRMMILKSIIIIIIIILVMIIGRKALILFSLSEKAEKNINSNNYYVRLSQYEGDTISIFETYKRDHKQITINNYYDNKNSKNSHKIIEYTDYNKTNLYIETNDEKTTLQNAQTGMLLPIKISETYCIKFENVYKLLKNSVFSSIKDVKCNGKDCYYISNIETEGQTVNEVINGIYIDKETGLPIRMAGSTIKNSIKTVDPIIELEYEFNKVTDEDVIEPDITKYRIQK